MSTTKSNKSMYVAILASCLALVAVAGISVGIAALAGAFDKNKSPAITAVAVQSESKQTSGGASQPERASSTGAPAEGLNEKVQPSAAAHTQDQDFGFGVHSNTPNQPVQDSGDVDHQDLGSAGPTTPQGSQAPSVLAGANSIDDYQALRGSRMYAFFNSPKHPLADFYKVGMVSSTKFRVDLLDLPQSDGYFFEVELDNGQYTVKLLVDGGILWNSTIREMTSDEDREVIEWVDNIATKRVSLEPRESVEHRLNFEGAEDQEAPMLDSVQSDADLESQEEARRNRAIEALEGSSIHRAFTTDNPLRQLADSVETINRDGQASKMNLHITVPKTPGVFFKVYSYLHYDQGENALQNRYIVDMFKNSERSCGIGRSSDLSVTVDEDYALNWIVEQIVAINPDLAPYEAPVLSEFVIGFNDRFSDSLTYVTSVGTSFTEIEFTLRDAKYLILAPDAGYSDQKIYLRRTIDANFAGLEIFDGENRDEDVFSYVEKLIEIDSRPTPIDPIIPTEVPEIDIEHEADILDSIWEELYDLGKYQDALDSDLLDIDFRDNALVVLVGGETVVTATIDGAGIMVDEATGLDRESAVSILIEKIDAALDGHPTLVGVEIVPMPGVSVGNPGITDLENEDESEAVPDIGERAIDKVQRHFTENSQFSPVTELTLRWGDRVEGQPNTPPPNKILEITAKGTNWQFIVSERQDHNGLQVSHIDSVERTRLENVEFHTSRKAEDAIAWIEGKLFAIDEDWVDLDDNQDPDLIDGGGILFPAIPGGIDVPVTGIDIPAPEATDTPEITDTPETDQTPVDTPDRGDTPVDKPDPDTDQDPDQESTPDQDVPEGPSIQPTQPVQPNQPAQPDQPEENPEEPCPCECDEEEIPDLHQLPLEVVYQDLDENGVDGVHDLSLTVSRFRNSLNVGSYSKGIHFRVGYEQSGNHKLNVQLDFNDLTADQTLDLIRSLYSADINSPLAPQPSLEISPGLA